MYQDRIDELRDLFWSETSENWTQEWRDDLSAAESELVSQWDRDCDRGIYNLCKAITELEEKRRDKEESK